MTNGSDSQFFPLRAVNVAPSGGDVDLTVIWAGQPYARAIWVGVAGDITVIHVGDTASVVYKNWPVGVGLYGCFATIKNAGTSATNFTVQQ